MCICVTASCTGNRSDCRERHHCSLPCTIFVISSTHPKFLPQFFPTQKYVFHPKVCFAVNAHPFHKIGCFLQSIWNCSTWQNFYSTETCLWRLQQIWPARLFTCSLTWTKIMFSCSPPTLRQIWCMWPPSSRHGRPALCQGDTGAGNLGTCLVSSLNSNSHSQDLIDCHAHHWLEKIPNYFGHI